MAKIHTYRIVKEYYIKNYQFVDVDVYVYSFHAAVSVIPHEVWPYEVTLYSVFLLFLNCVFLAIPLKQTCALPIEGK